MVGNLLGKPRNLYINNPLDICSRPQEIENSNYSLPQTDILQKTAVG